MVDTNKISHKQSYSADSTEKEFTLDSFIFTFGINSVRINDTKFTKTNNDVIFFYTLADRVGFYLANNYQGVYVRVHTNGEMLFADSYTHAFNPNSVDTLFKVSDTFYIIFKSFYKARYRTNFEMDLFKQ